MPRGFPGRFVTAAEATKRWRESNPDKARAAQKKRKPKPYNAAAFKAWRDKRNSSPDYREKINALANQRATTLRRWLDSYKLSVGCVDCGYKEHHAALHFDHVRGSKKFNVCNAKSLSRAQEEILKCEVRCANCHAARTFKQYPVNTGEVK